MNLKINIPGLELKNPIMPASGTFGFGNENENFYDINILGSIMLKATTLEARVGNKLPRVCECESGMLNAIGLQNPGIDKIIDVELKNLSSKFAGKVIANIAGSTIEEYVLVAKRISQVDIIGALEVNVSCPNVKEGGIQFGTNAEMLYELTKKIKLVSAVPVYIKLSPNVTNIVQLAKAAERGGADGISMINTLIGMRINLKTKKPILHNKIGGLSGNAIFPVALRMIYQVYEAVNIPIIGMGGVSNAYEVIEMMLAGASCVAIGTQNLLDPYACQKIIGDLKKVMEELEIDNLEDIIGKGH